MNPESLKTGPRPARYCQVHVQRVYTTILYIKRPIRVGCLVSTFDFNLTFFAIVITKSNLASFLSTDAEFISMHLIQPTDRWSVLAIALAVAVGTATVTAVLAVDPGTADSSRTAYLVRSYPVLKDRVP